MRQRRRLPAGRVLLRQWGHPSPFKQKDALLSHMECFASLAPESTVARELGDEGLARREP